jgi:hypothetical protein
VSRRLGGLPLAAPVVLSVRNRSLAWLLVLFVLALAALVFPSRAASAAPGRSTPAVMAADLCSVEEWQVDPARCIGELPAVAAQRAQCLKAPTPDGPDSGLGGWFATRPDASRVSGVKGLYVRFGYAGYSYTTYDIGCAPTLMHPDYKFENTVANGEFMIATAVIGASNAVRERAWDPGVMWGWADPLVEKATRSVYTKVFTVFGVITLAVVGVYLLWRSRQAEMSAAMTTAGWAVLVMVAVTALAAWPVRSAHLADQALTSSLAVIHDAVGPPPHNISAAFCSEDPDACRDVRPPAVRASDTAVETMLYRNWLRGALGSADSQTAQKYGEALYRARTFTWAELQFVREQPQTRDQIIQAKSEDWMRVAEQIRTEDPEAYQYLQGTKGMERIGAGFIAMIASLMFAMFDLTASLLVLLGFLIFRWAVIAAPIIGTIALLRPASGGFRRLVNAVVAALFNIIIFGTGAAIYLYAVDLVMNTVTIPGWLQVVLVLLCGVVGWMLLRPYRRITQLGGKDPLAAIASGGVFNRRQAQIEQAATAAAIAARPDTGRVPAVSDRPPIRVELRAEPPLEITGTEPGQAGVPPSAPTIPRRRMPAPVGDGWPEPHGADPGYALYRPSRSSATHDGPPSHRDRVEARVEA